MMSFCGIAMPFRRISNSLALLVLLLCTTGSGAAPHDSVLRYVILIHRHGDRSPTRTVPAISDERFNAYWPAGPGELTATGMNQLFTLGQQLRAKYIGPQATVSPNFLSTDFVPTEYRVRSTDYNRTLMSAQSLLYGLYPLGTGPNVSSNPTNPALPSNFQPIPIHTIPTSQDTLLIGKDYAETNCPSLTNYWSSVRSSAVYLQKEKENANFLQYLSNVTGLPANFTAITEVYDNFVCYGSHNYLGTAFPTVTQEQINQTQQLAAWYLQQLVSSKQETCLMNGVLLHDILAHFDAVTRSATMQSMSSAKKRQLPHGGLSMLDASGSLTAAGFPTKFQHYSAHDSTLFPLLATFGVFDGTNPPYASHIIFEMWQNGNSYSVKTTYQDNEIVLPGCGQALCPYDKFSQFFSTCGLPSYNYVQLCGANPAADPTVTELQRQLHDANEKIDRLTLIIALCASIAGAVILIGIYLRIRSNRQSEEQEYRPLPSSRDASLVV